MQWFYEMKKVNFILDFFSERETNCGSVLYPFISVLFEVSTKPVLQIRRGKRDNLKIIFHITVLKHIAAQHKNRLTETVLLKGHTMCVSLKN